MYEWFYSNVQGKGVSKKYFTFIGNRENEHNMPLANSNHSFATWGVLEKLFCVYYEAWRDCKVERINGECVVLKKN